MDTEKTRAYYASLKEEDLCQCDDCRFYRKRIRSSYPLLAQYFDSIGVDIKKPHETSPVPSGDGNVRNYWLPQYAMIGSKEDFAETRIGDLTLQITDSYPPVDTEEECFVIEIAPLITLQ